MPSPRITKKRMASTDTTVFSAFCSNVSGPPPYTWGSKGEREGRFGGEGGGRGGRPAVHGGHGQAAARGGCSKALHPTKSPARTGQARMQALSRTWSRTGDTTVGPCCCALPPLAMPPPALPPLALPPLRPRRSCRVKGYECCASCGLNRTPKRSATTRQAFFSTPWPPLTSCSAATAPSSVAAAGAEPLLPSSACAATSRRAPLCG
mgnify:CR=1 FL=1